MKIPYVLFKRLLQKCPNRRPHQPIPVEKLNLDAEKPSCVIRFFRIFLGFSLYLQENVLQNNCRLYRMNFQNLMLFFCLMIIMIIWIIVLLWQSKIKCRGFVCHVVLALGLDNGELLMKRLQNCHMARNCAMLIWHLLARQNQHFSAREGNLFKSYFLV